MPETATQTENATSSLTKVLFSWKAPVRPFKRRGKEFYTTVAAVAVLAGIIFFTLEGFLALVVVASLVFLVYVMSTVAPEQVEHQVSQKGVVFAGKTFSWNELTRFWFTERFGHTLLVIETIKIPGRLEMVISPSDKNTLQGLLEKHIVMEEATPSFMDKAASWLSKRVPLES